MKLNIIYSGDLGDGNISLDIDEQSRISELIDLFHKSIEKPKSYQIGGGAPPHRRIIDIDYDYQINGRRITENNEMDSLNTFGIKDESKIYLQIGGGGKVD